MHGSEHRSTAVRPSKDLNELHRGNHKRKAAAELEVANVRLDGGQPGRPLLEHGQQPGVRVERDHLVSVRREIGGNAPGAGTEVEDRAVRGVRELPPQEQVGVVGAVLGVVPGDGRGRRAAHSDHRFARPRSASRSRSSSSAV